PLPSPPDIYPLSLHDALPISRLGGVLKTSVRRPRICAAISRPLYPSRGHLQPSPGLLHRWPGHLSLARFGSPQSTEAQNPIGRQDRKSTRLNSSHLVISYAVF